MTTTNQPVQVTVVTPQKVVPPEPSTEVYLTLAYKFYDDIARGVKLVEYRDFYKWCPRLLTGNLKTVKFSRGYTAQQMRWEISYIGVIDIHGKEIAAFMPDGTMNPEGAAESFHPQYIALHLGKRIS